MTGWRFVAEECARAGVEVHLAEPAETRERQDRKRRAKTDKLDARLLRELLMQKRLPESWIAPPHILDLRAKVRLRKTLVDQRTQWLQRIHAVLFHHGVAVQAGQLGRLCAEQAREQLAGLDLPGSAARDGSRGPISQQALAKSVLRYATVAGIPPRLAHPHALRGYYATTLSAERVAIQDIKARLGHASIETTARYLAELGDQADDIGEVLDRHHQEQRRRRAT